MHPIRSSVAVLATIALALAAISPVAVAQEDTAEHPLVGAWVVRIDFDGDDQPDALNLTAFDADGTFVGASPEGPAIGSWEPIGERTADITFHALAGDPASGAVGLITIRASGEVAEDGQTFSATFTQELLAAIAEMVGAPEGQLGPGEVTAQRIAVEPMGEPAGPIPDFSQLQPPAEEAPAE